MFRIKRNSVIITALVIMIAFAGYLNYIDGNKTPSASETAMEEEFSGGLTALDDVAGQEVSIIRNGASDEITGFSLVDSEIGIAMTNEESAGSDGGTSDREPGAAVFVNSTNDSSFFVQAKLEREQARSKDKETLLQLINNTNLEKDQRAAYADQALAIQERTAKETSTETMIEAKGFTEAYVRIDENGVDVVVSKKFLTDSEIAQIEDIVKRKTGFDVQNITISPVKG